MRDKDPHRKAQLKRRFQGIHKLFTSLHTSHAASTTQSTHQAQSLLYTAPKLTPTPQPASHAVTKQTSELVTPPLTQHGREVVSPPTAHITVYKMEVSGSPGSYINLCEVNYEKDLGLWMTSSLKPSLQCDKAAASATRILGMHKRTFSFMSKELFVFLYKTYVRPHLEYCVQLWSSYLVRDIDNLERVQRHATKLVSEFTKLTYESRL